MAMATGAEESFCFHLRANGNTPTNKAVRILSPEEIMIVANKSCNEQRATTSDHSCAAHSTSRVGILFLNKTQNSSTRLRTLRAKEKIIIFVIIITIAISIIISRQSRPPMTFRRAGCVLLLKKRIAWRPMETAHKTRTRARARARTAPICRNGPAEHSARSIIKQRKLAHAPSWLN